MKRMTMTAVGGILLAMNAAPALAQDTELPATISDDSSDAAREELGELGALFGDMFGSADPLSAEEEARLPSAMLVVSKLFPKGTYARMMDESMGPMMEAMMGNLGGNSAISVAQLTGLSPLDLSALDADRLSKASAILDPAAQERTDAMTQMMVTLISDVMLDIEPAYRSGLARAYAVRFTNAELMDLAAYFETETGKKYAAESFLVFADPQVMSSMNEVMPSMMERMPDIMAATSAIEEDYAAGRRFSDLSAQEQGQLAELLGVSTEELAQSEPEAVDTGDAF